MEKNTAELSRVPFFGTLLFHNHFEAFSVWEKGRRTGGASWERGGAQAEPPCLFVYSDANISRGSPMTINVEMG